eukprot:m.14690 g.14690  ORF g.14690 m.14690 type:complete len:512 (+) comp2961_c0_seq1:142-1677(+)
MAASFSASRAPIRPNNPLTGRGVTIPSVSAPARTGLEPIIRAFPSRGRVGKEEEMAPLKGLASAGDELQTPEALAQSVASGTRFIIQHLPPLEASLPALPTKAVVPEVSDELPDLAAAAVSLETAHDASIKPHLSFACLIALAILDSPIQRLTVSEIYEWIKLRFPYFATAAAGLGWKNSVRHNLSLNRLFVKRTREEDEAGGKGSYWCIRSESVAPLEACVVKQAKIYQRYGGGLAQIAGGPCDIPAADGLVRAPVAGFRPAPPPSSLRKVQRRQPFDMKEVSSTDAAAALISLTSAAAAAAAALPAVKGRAGARPRTVVSVRPNGSAPHSASLRYYPDARAVRPGAEALSATFTAGTMGSTIVAVSRNSAGLAREEEADGGVSPVPMIQPSSDEGIGVTPDLCVGPSPRKRSSSTMVYTFTAPMSVPDAGVRHVPDGRRSPPHARRRLALRTEALEEEQSSIAAVAAVADTLSAGAALLSLAGMHPPMAEEALLEKFAAASAHGEVNVG